MLKEPGSKSLTFKVKILSVVSLQVAVEKVTLLKKVVSVDVIVGVKFEFCSPTILVNVNPSEDSCHW